ncbi:UDP-glycosyltransferase 83A1 [Linum perenne]
MTKQPHVIMIPLPAQGHLLPLMKLAHKLADRGIDVTVMNLEIIHRKIVDAMRFGRVRLVGVPDELELDQVKQMESMGRIMPAELRRKVEEIEVVCVVADVSLAWAFREAKALGIKTAAFSPASAANLALLINIPRLLQLGALDHDEIRKFNVVGFVRIRINRITNPNGKRNPNLGSQRVAMEPSKIPRPTPKAVIPKLLLQRGRMLPEL